MEIVRGSTTYSSSFDEATGKWVVWCKYRDYHKGVVVALFDSKEEADKRVAFYGRAIN